MRSLKLLGILGTAALALLSGCAADTGGTGADPEMETVTTSEEKVIVGIWAGPFSNGNVGQSPKVWNGTVVCEAFEGIPFPPTYYAGKVYQGKCRYAKNGVAVAASTYFALQAETGMYDENNPGFTPNDAIATSAGTAVCRPAGFVETSGRVSGGKCLFEWGGNAFSSSSFWFLGRH